MNMILHGIESPNIIHQNTLETNIQEIQNKDRVDILHLAEKKKQIYKKTSQLRLERLHTYFFNTL